jgi:hypothetical protein
LSGSFDIIPGLFCAVHAVHLCVFSCSRHPSPEAAPQAGLTLVWTLRHGDVALGTLGAGGSPSESTPWHGADSAVRTLLESDTSVDRGGVMTQIASERSVRGGAVTHAVRSRTRCACAGAAVWPHGCAPAPSAARERAGCEPVPVRASGHAHVGARAREVSVGSVRGAGEGRGRGGGRSAHWPCPPRWCVCPLAMAAMPSPLARLPIGHALPPAAGAVDVVVRGRAGVGGRGHCVHELARGRFR